MNKISLKITINIVSTIAAILMVSLAANANQIYLPLVVQSENAGFILEVSTPIPSSTEITEPSSDNPNISPVSTYPAPPTDNPAPPIDAPGPRITPSPTATFAPGVPTYTPSPTSTPWPTYTPSSTFTPGPSPTNLRIGVGTPVPDGWVPPFGP